jgi:hypothetical protein
MIFLEIVDVRLHQFEIGLNFPPGEAEFRCLPPGLLVLFCAPKHGHGHGKAQQGKNEQV